MFARLYAAVGWLGLTVIAIFAVAVLTLGTIFAIAKFDEAASKPIGDAQKQEQINSGQNQLTAQTDLKLKKATVERYEAQIQADKQTVAAHPGDAFDQSTLDADQGGCRNAVADYNSAASDDQEKPYLPTDYPTAYKLDVCD